MIKLLIFLIVLIPTLIAVLLFFVSYTLFTTPDVLFGAYQKTVAVLCSIGGCLLLIPLAVSIVIVGFNSINNKKRN